MYYIYNIHITTFHAHMYIGNSHTFFVNTISMISYFYATTEEEKANTGRCKGAVAFTNRGVEYSPRRGTATAGPLLASGVPEGGRWRR